MKSLVSRWLWFNMLKGCAEAPPATVFMVGVSTSKNPMEFKNCLVNDTILELYRWNQKYDVNTYTFTVSHCKFSQNTIHSMYLGKSTRYIPCYESLPGVTVGEEIKVSVCVPLFCIAKAPL